LCLSSFYLALHLSDYSFLVHHPVNQDDRHLLAHAMASDFTVAWQYSQREQWFCFLLRIKLDAFAGQNWFPKIGPRTSPTSRTLSGSSTRTWTGRWPRSGRSSPSGPFPKTWRTCGPPCCPRTAKRYAPRSFKIGWFDFALISFSVMTEWQWVCR
jgi:hypothetical protein